MEITFLGTGSMMPTKERAQTALYMSYLDQHFLFDCGEGVQRQLRIAHISPAKITKIFLTHWHGDHYFGLPGLLENMAKHKDEKIIDIYGPRGTKKNVQRLMDACKLHNKIDVVVHDIPTNKVFLDEEYYQMKSTHLSHGVPCLAYTFEEKPKRKVKMDYLKKMGVPEGPIIRQLQEGKNIVFRGKKITAKEATTLQPGKKVAIILDTKMHPSCIAAAKNADVLICEATFNNELQKKARAYYHLTAQEAGKLAKKAKVKRLVLTHFSQRYSDIGELLKEAREQFPNTIASEDFMTITV